MECDERRAGLALQSLARFHAVYWNKPQLLKNTFSPCTFQSNLVNGVNSRTTEHSAGLFALRNLSKWHEDTGLHKSMEKWNRLDHVTYVEEFGLEALFTPEECRALEKVRTKMTQPAFRHLTLGTSHNLKTVQYKDLRTLTG